MSKETHLKLLQKLEKDPDCSQRQLAKEVDVSLGKLNYCLKKLIEKGWVKASNFRKNPDKRAYYKYLLTPSGIEAKAKLTVQFLQEKIKEYDRLQKEIEQLRQEVQKIDNKKNNLE